MITAAELLGVVQHFRPLKGQRRLNVLADDETPEFAQDRQRLMRAARYQRNREIEKARASSWTKTHAEQKNATTAKWRAANRERVREMNRRACRKFREKNKERLNAERRKAYWQAKSIVQQAKEATA